MRSFIVITDNLNKKLKGLNKILFEKNAVSKAQSFNSRFFDRQVSYKYLFQLSDKKFIETTAYLHFKSETLIDIAIDISTMVGCPMRCSFCAAGSIKYKRSLTEEEIVGQVEILLRKHQEFKSPKIICSFQGIGEPSLIPNKIINASKALLKLDERIRISISTLGYEIRAFKLWRDANFNIDNLQISFSSFKDDQLMPRKYSINDLVNEAIKCNNNRRIKKVKFNYILMSGLNDSDFDIERLISTFRNTGLIVKISSLNQTKSSRENNLCPSTFERASYISNRLLKEGIDSFVFGAFDDMNISCGQLAFLEKPILHELS